MPRRSQPSPPPTAPCGCAAPPPRVVGPGARAAGVDADLKCANIRHLRRIEGQIRGIAAMVESDRYCPDIITQVAAARQSLRAIARNLLHNHLRHCAAAAMSEGPAARDRAVAELLDLAAKLDR